MTEVLRRPPAVGKFPVEEPLVPKIARPEFLPTEAPITPSMHVPKMEGGFTSVPHKGPAIRAVGPADIEACWKTISEAILARYPRADLGALKGWLCMQAGRRDVYFRRRTDSEVFLFLEVQRSALEPEGILVEVFSAGGASNVFKLQANASVWASENRIPVVSLSAATSSKAKKVETFVQPSTVSAV